MEGFPTRYRTDKLFLKLGFVNKRSIPGIIDDIALKIVTKTLLRTSEYTFYPHKKYLDFPDNLTDVERGDDFRPIFIREKSVVYSVLSFDPKSTFHPPAMYETPRVFLFIKTDRNKRWRMKKSFNIHSGFPDTALDESVKGEETYSLERVELFTRDLDGKLRTGELIDEAKTRYFSHSEVLISQLRRKIFYHTWGKVKKWAYDTWASVSVIGEVTWAWFTKPIRELYWSRITEYTIPRIDFRVSINRSEVAKEARDLYNYLIAHVKAAVEFINKKEPADRQIETLIPEKASGTGIEESFWVYRNEYTLKIELRGGIVRFQDSSMLHGGKINFEITPLTGFTGDWFCRENRFGGRGKLIYIDRIVPKVMDTFLLYSRRG